MDWLRPKRLPRWTRLLFVKKSRATSTNSQYIIVVFPPNPRELLRDRLEHEVPLLNRRIDARTNNPFAALYRIYEHIMLDQHLQIRNEFEAFWLHRDWKVCQIPDPRDPDPERYAVVACIPALLCRAFNRRIGLGLPRNTPPIFTRTQLDAWRSQEREYESEPVWTRDVPQLNDELAIPRWDNEKRQFVPLGDSEKDKGSEAFAKKNILIWQPHIHFI
jgi:hypothetical protein